MQQLSMFIVVYLVVELDLSSWKMWAAEGMKQTFMIALTVQLSTVITAATQE